MRWTWKELAVIAGAGILAYHYLKKDAPALPQGGGMVESIPSLLSDVAKQFTGNVEYLSALATAPKDTYVGRNEFGEGIAVLRTDPAPTTSADDGKRYPVYGGGSRFIQDVASAVNWQISPTGQAQNIVVEAAAQNVAVVKPAEGATNYVAAMQVAERAALNIAKATGAYGTTTAGGIILTPSPEGKGSAQGAVPNTNDIASRLARGLM